MSIISPPREDPFLIDYLQKQYERVEVLSDTGGMGRVYKCFKGNRITVVKSIRQGMEEQPLADRFKREIRILRSINHPNVVKIYNFNDEVEPYWYEMEYAPVGDLKRLIPHIHQDVTAIKKIFVEICEGLRHLHENPISITHRDLKPHNVLIFENQTPKISDVGLARFVNRDTTSITYTGDTWGSFFYMSPEQIEDFKNVDHRADIYALGVILYEMFTNSPDRQGVDLDAVLPRPFNSLVRKMTQRNPNARYQTVHDLLADYGTKVSIYEQVSPYGDPEGDFNEAVAALLEERPGDTINVAKMDIILKILHDHSDIPDFMWKKIASIPLDVIERMARQEPDTLDTLVALYANAINKIMERPFPFGLMDTWTDFLRSIYERAEKHATKRLCLDRIAYMGFVKGQHYSILKLKEMLSSFHTDRDIDIAIDVFENHEWKEWIAKAMKQEAMNPRLRGFFTA